MSIGDISGHGIDRFEIMVETRNVIRKAMLNCLDPVASLAHANRFLCANHTDLTATGILGILDTKKRSLTFANAGHPAPLMADARKTRFLQSGEAGLLLGVDPNATTTLHEVALPTSSLLVFYTDGVTEHKKDVLQGTQDLLDAATDAYEAPSFQKAERIEKKMYLNGFNRDDVAILTAFLQ